MACEVNSHLTWTLRLRGVFASAGEALDPALAGLSLS